MNHPLDNVIWSALTTQHAALAEGGALARRYPPKFAFFAAMPEPTAEAFEALAQMVPEGKGQVLFSVADVAPSAHFEVTLRRDMLQMIGPRRAGGLLGSTLTPLVADDVAEMRALAELTQPGPFFARTNELGDFLGVRVDGKLAAMVGERMRLDGYTEISAVCADPAFRGRGFARDLLVAVSNAIVARGDTPFLHVLADNHLAVALYRKLGFEIRAQLRLTAVQRVALG